MSQARQQRYERQARHRKKLDKQKVLNQVKEHAKRIGKAIAEKIKRKTRQVINDFRQSNQAKHRKKVDKEKVEKITEKVILKTGLVFAIVFIPLFIVCFVFFEFGGLIKDAIEFFAGIIQGIANVVHHIVGAFQKIIDAFKLLKK